MQGTCLCSGQPNIFLPLEFTMICCLRKSCVVLSLQMVCPLSSSLFYIRWNVDITKLNHYDIIQNTVSFEKPAEGIRNFSFFQTSALHFLFFAKCIFWIQTVLRSFVYWIMPCVRTEKCSSAVTTDELMNYWLAHFYPWSKYVKHLMRTMHHQAYCAEKVKNIFRQPIWVLIWIIWDSHIKYSGFQLISTLQE
jgi:hypothetical protein